MDHRLTRNKDLLPCVRNNDLIFCVLCGLFGVSCHFLIMLFSWAFLCHSPVNAKGEEKMESCFSAGTESISLVHLGLADSGLSNW